MSTFFGLNISRLGMMAQQKALEVTSHNIANANTPGYSRQVAHMGTTTPLSYPQGQGMLGSGVLVDEVARVRNSFLDSQIRKENQTLAKWETRNYFLGQIETVFMEPSETGFNKTLSRFFDSWQELSLNPEGSPARAALIENSNAFVNSVHHTYEQLKTIRSDMSEQITMKVDEVNTLAEQIKDLNRQITTLTAKGDTPADLLDRRDLLLDDLSEIIEFDTVFTPSGSVNLYLGGRALVYENTANKLATAPGGNDEHTGWPLSPKIVWERDDREVKMQNGQLAGIIETRDVSLKQYMEDFESMIWGVVNAVNLTHTQGMDLHGERGGEYFTFTGDHLETLQVSEDIKKEPSRIAAALYPDPEPDQVYAAPGDGSNAVNIAQLRQGKISIDTDPETSLQERVTLDPEGTTTFEHFYRDNIARIGVDTQESDRMAQNQASLLAMLGQRKDSISGVSLDEEMANMVQFQLAYQASARVITTFDDIYDTLINRMLR
ncbi:flagellar hook-associated protein FlgK [Dethiobacter alkaliphilus]|uniref:flagellar hook-associated protein FlgK n=1 Tax=Dethiobacter alkaliphilus TaxID=427926 RepID=UPI0022269A02|nr:flagellar hook-associated protein FlgK [Dethiobacter alkaliphilus]MCW3488757.1 flagellar hook-associated protein FlgK [Dethiobacter alkaliphilus]